MIAIIDYGMGNLRSVQKGFEKVGFPAEIVTGPEAVLQAQGVVLPGVGAFGDAMRNLRAAGFIEAIYEVVSRGTPFLGICLGLQLMFEESEEWGLHRGLGLFPGRVKKFPPGLKIPHMGWNQIEIQQETPILKGIPDKSAFYFVHSYYVDAGEDVTLARTEYGIPFTSIAGNDTVFGIQFHPEKSSKLGLQILKNFGGLVSC
ncbi:imidazole glycerol phosphate synthase, glutamine amidotransferase subunit [Thermincola ferriacetica]|uniref:Imidazole glycerol phosphate synthase subunit HisH n=1 Tax=Thermincola ferriacetica TaxID=281456 RepID=A0A0L6W0G4_9FIRM|nr:imidazole glycerol phosphate synthase subunit HisH [Thermincola ferriacetica]KNZ69072.1 imidazole glycerol phosphate synthase, glutamine amidotransferase subunit [Thermincola ferriacetica]